MSRPNHDHAAGRLAKFNRSHMPISEAAIWLRIRNRQLAYRFRRQVPIGPWIADFACLNPKVVIEVDGASHEYRAESKRTEFLEGRGFTVIRISNETVATDIDGHLSLWLRARIREIDGT